MTKQRTSWSRKGTTAASTQYNDDTVDYDGGTQKYASSGQTHQSVIKKLTSWTKMTKQLTEFVINPSSTANQQTFDTNRVYDVAATFDGIVANEPASTAKKPTAWSKA